MRPSRDSDAPIARAIEGLYATFGHYPAPPEPELSPLKAHLIDHARALHRARLSEIPAEALERYAFHALTTWGGVDEFKHFLPRLLELSWLEPHWADTDLLVGKLGRAEWRRWPAPERQAVDHFLEAWFDSLLDDIARRDQVGPLLAGLTLAKLSLGPWLSRWFRTRSYAATLHIADLIDAEGGALRERGRVSRSYLEPGRTELTDWLRSSETRERIERTYFDAPDAPHAERLATASDILAALPKRELG